MSGAGSHPGENRLNQKSNPKPRVVIVGAGFAGLWAAKTLAGRDVLVTLVDRNNYHTFQALLYQVATATLEPESIAFPIRTTLSPHKNITYVMARALRVDRERKALVTNGPEVPYDYLIMATGSIPADFGIPGIAEHAFTLKTLEDAVQLRNHIIRCFERASAEADPDLRDALLTFVVAGGGATGVEFAGALSELLCGSLAEDFPSLDFSKVRVVLVEGAAELLGGMPKRVRAYASERLRKLDVELVFSRFACEVTGQAIHFRDGGTLETRTVVWTAGVRAEPLAEASGLSVGRDGRVEVLATMRAAEDDSIYVVGDLARINEEGKALPMVAQVAIQSAGSAAANILARIGGRHEAAFRYNDLGSMVVIGRNAAGAEIAGRTYTGFFAWLLWLGVHLTRLIGYRNRVVVLINWAWDYIFYERALRFIFPAASEGEPRKPL